MKRSSWSIHIALFAGLIAVVVVMGSCGSTRELTYLQGQFDTARLSKAVYPIPVIQKNDLLGISVYSDDPRASAYYNLPAQTVVSNTGGMSANNDAISPANGSTYLVDENGFILMPGVGRMQVAGLTKGQLDTMLVDKFKGKLQNPYVIIRMASYTITLIGEVTKPGQFTIPNERVSLLEAIALAGDLTPYGRRESILIIREINGQRTYQRLNLKDPEILGSPYFYLQPNDVVIVDPNKTKASVNDAVIVRNIAIVVSLISVLAVVASVTGH
jgi:polysaccharide export outer membrane protein